MQTPVTSIIVTRNGMSALEVILHVWPSSQAIRWVFRDFRVLYTSRLERYTNRETATRKDEISFVATLLGCGVALFLDVADVTSLGSPHSSEARVHFGAWCHWLHPADGRARFTRLKRVTCSRYLDYSRNVNVQINFNHWKISKNNCKRCVEAGGL